MHLLERDPGKSADERLRKHRADMITMTLTTGIDLFTDIVLHYYKSRERISRVLKRLSILLETDEMYPK